MPFSLFDCISKGKNAAPPVYEVSQPGFLNGFVTIFLMGIIYRGINPQLFIIREISAGKTAGYDLQFLNQSERNNPLTFFGHRTKKLEREKVRLEPGNLLTIFLHKKILYQLLLMIRQNKIK